MYCLLIATIKILSGAPLQVFFYHDLVEPTLHHAIQYSILVFIALVWLLENRGETIGLLPASFSRFIVPFLSIFLLLLSSKLIISFFIVYLLSFFLRQRVQKTRVVAICIAIIVATLLLVSTRNPVGDRFRAIFSGNMWLFKQPSFRPGVYFNGAQFRLLQWRFTYEILNEHNAWPLGLSPGDAQSSLDKKYTETNMYTGIPGTEKHGFLGYHTHNQFLQSLLENGVIGLCLFILVCYALFMMAKQDRSRQLKWVVSLLIIYCFTDAPFQTQYGIVIFTLFPCLTFLSASKDLLQESSLTKRHLTLQNIQKQPN
ncbi:MAG: O-antigen ligase family protein [Flavisolibacter sp.]